MSIVNHKPLNLHTLTRDWSAFAAEVSTNRLLASHLMRLVELITLPATTDELEADIRAAEVRIVLGMIAKEVLALAMDANHG